MKRRALLAGCAAGALLGFWGSGGGAQSSATFMETSATLTGYQDLDPALGAALQDAFETAGTRDPVPADLLAAWYSGSVPGPDGGTFVSYLDALIWRTLTFTKPQGFCGGALGYWAAPPEV
ncbi:MAG: hypothetical protein Kilf2KO_44050 [Rhodospirillales bacterium]